MNVQAAINANKLSSTDQKLMKVSYWALIRIHLELRSVWIKHLISNRLRISRVYKTTNRRKSCLVVLLRPVVEVYDHGWLLSINRLDLSDSPVEVVFRVQIQFLSEVLWNIVILWLFNIPLNIFFTFYCFCFWIICKTKWSTIMIYHKDIGQNLR